MLKIIISSAVWSKSLFAPKTSWWSEFLVNTHLQWLKLCAGLLSANLYTSNCNCCTSDVIYLSIIWRCAIIMIVFFFFFLGKVIHMIGFFSQCACRWHSPWHYLISYNPTSTYWISSQNRLRLLTCFLEGCFAKQVGKFRSGDFSYFYSPSPFVFDFLEIHEIHFHQYEIVFPYGNIMFRVWIPRK